MAKEKSRLQKKIESGDQILIVEIALPATGDADAVRRKTKKYAGRCDAIGLSDNRAQVRMSALAGASLVASAGVEPILHMITRDRNRIALVSDCLGAEALGVRNLLCTSGTHQTLGRFSAAKNVFDLDAVQLLQTVRNLGSNGSIVGERAFNGTGPFCLGAVASPFADPAQMQLRRLVKKVDAGAQFLITQPVFDVARLEAWWKIVVERCLERETAIVAGIRILTSAEEAKACAEERPDPMLPRNALKRIVSEPDKTSQRASGIALAVETICRLQALPGLRGFEIRCEGDDDAVLETLEKSRFIL